MEKRIRIDLLPPLQHFGYATDLKMLRQQKETLLRLANNRREFNIPKSDAANIAGLINWIDSFQDILVDYYHVNPVLVYGEFDE